MRKLLFGVLLLVFPSLGLAQNSQSPPTPPQTRQVLIVGDQLAGGMGAGLTRVAQGDGSIQVINRFNESSGLSRPELYDWASAIPKIAEGKAFTTALVMIGFNDRRDIRDGDKTLKFGTPEWDTIYKTRIDAVMDALSAQHMQIFWMSEPSFGDPALDADMQNVSTLVKDRAAAKGAVYVDMRSPFLNPQGGYTDRGLDDTGTERRLREADGVTFFKQGNNRLGQIALSAVKSGVSPVFDPAAGKDVLGRAAPAPVPSVSVQPQASLPMKEDDGPIFGQEGLEVASGNSGGSKQLAVAVEQDKATKKAAAESSIGIGAAKGSNAEALFTTGLAAPAPAGRFDDFTAPALPN